jgi:serine protease Do
MVRAWVAAIASIVIVVPPRADAVRRGYERYWTEAKARNVRAQRSELSTVSTRAMPAVVSITTTQAPTDDPKSDEQTGLGSGFIIHPSGYILTSAHVIEDAAEIRVSLLTRDGFTDDYTAEIVGQDEQTDFALLKIRPLRRLPVLQLGRSSDVEIGDWVVVIGNPFGLGHSVSVGVVSFKGRTEVTPAGLEGFFDYIQTDAAINPGNSGGPLLDVHGNVVAIANAVNVSGQGIGFAVPVDVAKSVIPHLIREGRVRRGWVGISIQDLTPQTVDRSRSPAGHGVMVSEVIDNSPAARAGIRVGDVITRVDGVGIRRAHALRWRVSNKGAGRRVRLEVKRDGRPVLIDLRLEEQPSIAEDGPPDPTPGKPAKKRGSSNEATER